jgi:hypothetical protein
LQRDDVNVFNALSIYFERGTPVIAAVVRYKTEKYECTYGAKQNSGCAGPMAFLPTSELTASVFCFVACAELPSAVVAALTFYSKIVSDASDLILSKTHHLGI